MAADVDDVSAAPGITRPLAHLQTIEIAQRESRAPTGETLLAGKARPLKSNSPPHARKPLKSGFPTIFPARLPQERHFETGSL
jgi:hypothetical protein